MGLAASWTPISLLNILFGAEIMKDGVLTREPQDVEESS